MNLFKKFLILFLLPLIILVLIHFLTVSSSNEFENDFFVIFFSIGFFLIIAFNAVYISNYFKKRGIYFFQNLLFSGFITLSSISFYSFIISTIIKAQSYRFSIIFSQALLGFSVFILEMLLLYILDKKNDYPLKFEDKKYKYFLLIFSIFIIESTLYTIMNFEDLKDFNLNFWHYKYIFLYMFNVTVISFLIIVFFNKLKVNGILNILCSSIISVFLSLALFFLIEKKLNFRLVLIFIFYLIGLFSTLSNYAYLFYKTQINENRRLKNQNFKKEIQYQELKNQINPHFLFNNLNTLISFIEVNPKKAIDFGHNLANVYRHYLKKQENDFVLLKDELLFIKEYLEIYKTKFENGFIFSISEELDSNQYILTSTIQELIDNIFKHNSLDEDNPIEINIYIENSYLIVSNTLSSKLTTNSNNLGLENINKRYEILTNTSIVISNEENRFNVKLPILDLE